MIRLLRIDESPFGNQPRNVQLLDTALKLVMARVVDGWHVDVSVSLSTCCFRYGSGRTVDPYPLALA
jgi:hypothetical protein